MNEQASAELKSIIDSMSSADRAYVGEMPEDEVGILHFSLGMFIRNRIRKGGLPALLKWARDQAKYPDSKFVTDPEFDEASGFIVVAVWKVLQPERGSDTVQAFC